MLVYKINKDILLTITDVGNEIARHIVNKS